MRTNNLIEGYWNRLGNRILYTRSRESYVLSILLDEANHYESNAFKILFPNKPLASRMQSSRITIKEKDPIISKTKMIIFNYLLQEPNKTEAIICKTMNLPDLFDEDVVLNDGETDEKKEFHENEEEKIPEVNSMKNLNCMIEIKNKVLKKFKNIK